MSKSKKVPIAVQTVEPPDTDVWPAVAHMLIWNLYARLTGQNAFAHMSVTGRKDSIGRNWKVSHARRIDGVTVPLNESYIILICEVDRALVDRALGDASRIRSVYAERLRTYHALGREVDRLEGVISEQKAKNMDHSSASIKRASTMNEYAEVEKHVHEMRTRYEECRQIVASAEAWEFQIPFTSLENFALYGVPFKKVEAKIPAPKLEPLTGMPEAINA